MFNSPKFFPRIIWDTPELGYDLEGAGEIVRTSFCFYGFLLEG